MKKSRFAFNSRAGAVTVVKTNRKNLKFRPVQWQSTTPGGRAF
jgi:hypothetical protein